MPAVRGSRRGYEGGPNSAVVRLPGRGLADSHATASASVATAIAYAVRSLLTRLQPRRVHVAVQPGWTHLDATALGHVLATYARETRADTALLQDPESPGTKKARYRHGKLIEWVTVNGERHAMTGSPNLSTAALLKRGGAGGNHELAVTGARSPRACSPVASPSTQPAFPLLLEPRTTLQWNPRVRSFGCFLPSPRTTG
jgi:hypothetical protein